MKNTLLVLSLMAANSFAEETITFALAGPTTGAVTQYGTLQTIGATAAIEDINASGGINGKKIVAKIYDDACEAKQAVNVANQIVNDGVQFVIGHLCSAATLPAADIYAENDILMITAASTVPELTQKGNKTIFRTIGTDSQSAPASTAYIVDVLKPKKIALLHDKQQYGQGLAEGVRDALKEKGVEIAVFEGVSQGQTDFSALITKLKNEGVDFVYWGGFHPEAGLIIRQSAEQGFKPIFMGADGVDNQDLFAVAGQAANGILATIPPKHYDLPENEKILATIDAKQQNGRAPFVMESYAAVKIIADAANELKTEDPTEIAKLLHSGREFSTPIGKVSFSENGDLKNYQAVIYELNADGSRTKK